MNGSGGIGGKIASTFMKLALLGLMAFLPACGGGGGGADAGGGGSDTYWSGTSPTGTPVFAARYVLDNFGSAMSVLENPDHTFLFAGYRLPDGMPSRIYLVKTDTTGGVIWEKSHLSPDNGPTLATSVRRTADGGYIVAGVAGYASADWFYLLKLNANGDNTWSRRYAGVLAGQNGFQSVVQTADNGYVAVGAKDTLTAKWIDVYLVKTDPLGNVLDSRYYGGNGPDGAAAVQQTRDGGFVIAGEYNSGGPGGGWIYLVRTNGSLDEVWSRTYAHGRASAVVQSADNGFVLTGYVMDAAGKTDLFVMKTNAAGDNIVSKAFGGAKNDAGGNIAATKDGGYIVTGSTHSFSTGSDPAPGAWQTEEVFLIRLTANLDTVWQVAKGRAPDSGDNGGAVLETYDNNYLVGGTLGGSPLLMKFDRNGDTATLGETDFTYRPTTAGVIIMPNAEEAAGAGATSLDIARRIGPFGLDLLIGVLGGDPPADFCTVGGTYDNTLTPGPVGAGTVYTVNFHHCVVNMGDNVTLNGTYGMTFDNVTGTITGASYTLDTRIHLDNLVFTDSVGPTTLQGDLRFRRTATSATNWTDQADSAPATSLNLATSGITLQIAPFAVQSVGTGFKLGPATATVLHGGIGTLDVSIPASNLVQGSSWTEPTSGVILTTAMDNSSVKATVLSGSAVRLDVDTDGNGTIDGTQGTTWDDLLY